MHKPIILISYCQKISDLVDFVPFQEISDIESHVYHTSNPTLIHSSTIATQNVARIWLQDRIGSDWNPDKSFEFLWLGGIQRSRKERNFEYRYTYVGDIQ